MKLKQNHWSCEAAEPESRFHVTFSRRRQLCCTGDFKKIKNQTRCVTENQSPPAVPLYYCTGCSAWTNSFFSHFKARVACNLYKSQRIGFIHEITVRISVAQPADTITILQTVRVRKRLSNSTPVDTREKSGTRYSSTLAFVPRRRLNKETSPAHTPNADKCHLSARSSRYRRQETD